MEKVYSFQEGLQVLRGQNKHFDKKVIYRAAVISAACVMDTVKTYAATTATGNPKLDQAGWKLVNIIQAVIFWASMLYTFKALLEKTLKGEGSWKNVGTGFLICAMDYMIPWAFETIRSIFK